MLQKKQMAGKLGGTVSKKRFPRKEKTISWQKSVKTSGEDIEKSFNGFFEHFFENSNYEIEKNPRGFRNLYSKPDDDCTYRQGIQPEFLIRNKNSQKSIIVEIKRQGVGNGGNAHERACRYFMRGMEAPLKKICNTKFLPVWIVYANGIARDEKRIREIRFWFNGLPKYHYCFWSNISSYTEIKTHFEKLIEPALGKLSQKNS